MGVPFFGMVVGKCGPSLSAAEGVSFDPFPVSHMRTGEMIYVLGRREEAVLCENCTHKHGRYFIQGLFSDPVVAEEAAIDETYFVGPLPLNMALPYDPIEWAGLYWPFQERKNEETGSDYDSGNPHPSERTS